LKAKVALEAVKGEKTIRGTKALERPLKLSCPEIFNSDQGSQFTETLEKIRRQINMDGRGGYLTTPS